MVFLTRAGDEPGRLQPGMHNGLFVDFINNRFYALSQSAM